MLVGHLVASTYGTRPKTRIPVLNLDLETELPTDCVFDFGEDKAKLHLPIKISTRERIIQAWAHQRLLDGVYGTNRFRGLLVCLTETNKRVATNSVVEVCLPRQWQLYQMYIAQLWRIYYFDIPHRYLEIHARYPFIQVKHFAEFFREKDTLISAPPG